MTHLPARTFLRPDGTSVLSHQGQDVTEALLAEIERLRAENVASSAEIARLRGEKERLAAEAKRLRDEIAAHQTGGTEEDPTERERSAVAEPEGGR